MIISRDIYLNKIKNIESAYLIQKENNQLFILSDMEYGGDFEKARIEEMNFELDVLLPLSEAVIQCRDHYCGGISFIEYEEEDPTQTAINDFCFLKGNCVDYLIGNDISLYSEVISSSKKYFYLLFER